MGGIGETANGAPRLFTVKVRQKCEFLRARTRAAVLIDDQPPAAFLVNPGRWNDFLARTASIAARLAATAAFSMSDGSSTTFSRLEPDTCRTLTSSAAPPYDEVRILAKSLSTRAPIMI